MCTYDKYIYFFFTFRCLAPKYLIMCSIKFHDLLHAEHILDKISRDDGATQNTDELCVIHSQVIQAERFTEPLATNKFARVN